MQKIVVSALLALSLSQASTNVPTNNCTVSQDGKLDVIFEAYKTNFKVSVGAKFDDVKYSAVTKSGKTFHDIFVGSSVDIDTKSVNSKNKGRDINIVDYFFNKMKGRYIKAKIIDMTPSEKYTVRKKYGQANQGKLTIEVTMNGVTKKVPMKYIFKDDLLRARGVIKISEFSASDALSSLTKACYEKHLGKTWDDVAISFSTPIKAVCAPAK